MKNSKPSLDTIYRALLTRREQRNRLRKLTLRGPGIVDFSSNGYLSLSTNPGIKAEYLTHLQNSGDDFSLGSCGSRLLDGNSALAEELESDIAAFHGAPAALLFNSGFEANTGLFACAPQPGDVVVYDELIHASVRDGMKLSRATAVPFAHSCVTQSELPADSTLQSLEEVLGGLKRGANGDETGGGGIRNVFVAVEGVYSMDGDVAPLKSIVECVERQLPRRSGHIIVDEAHSTGWMGHRGRGLVSQLGLEDRVWARVHTFGKAMGCAGAVVLSSPTTRSYLINYARSLIYTTAMGFPMLTAIRTVYDYIGSGRAEPLVKNLANLMEETHRLLSNLSAKYSPPSHLLRVNAAPPQSPVIPLFSGRARSLATYCQKRGFMVRPIVAPTVPERSDRVRLCLHAANTVADVRGLCLAVEDWLLNQLDGDSGQMSELSRGSSRTQRGAQQIHTSTLSKL